MDGGDARVTDSEVTRVTFCPIRGEGARCMGPACAWCVGRDEWGRPVCAVAASDEDRERSRRVRELA